MRPPRRAASIAVGIVALGSAASACDRQGSGETADVSVTAPPTTVADVSPPSTPPTSGGNQIEPGLQGRVAIAVEDLAQRLGVDESEIEVRTARPVTWPDASLGCPQPGMKYAQVVTDGALIELAHEGTVYPYHMGGSRYRPFLCENSKARTEQAPQTTIELEPGRSERSVPMPGYDD